MIELPDKTFSVVLADPPWSYNTWKSQKSRTADSKYPVLPLQDIKAMPMQSILADNAAVFLWVTAPMLNVQLDVLKSWGLRYVTVAFTWVKLGRKPLDVAKSQAERMAGNPIAYAGASPAMPHKLHMGLGHYTRANAEFCILGLKGKMPVSSRSVHQILLAPLREHSRKPDEQWSRIDDLYPDGDRVELFARPSVTRPSHWHTWGLEVD
jgi:N6-adenosine-specific RNA methylase IME4